MSRYSINHFGNTTPLITILIRGTIIEGAGCETSAWISRSGEHNARPGSLTIGSGTVSSNVLHRTWLSMFFNKDHASHEMPVVHFHPLQHDQRVHRCSLIARFSFIHRQSFVTHCQSTFAHHDLAFTQCQSACDYDGRRSLAIFHLSSTDSSLQLKLYRSHILHCELFLQYRFSFQCCTKMEQHEHLFNLLIPKLFQTTAAPPTPTTLSPCQHHRLIYPQ